MPAATKLLDRIECPSDLSGLSDTQLAEVASELKSAIQSMTAASHKDRRACQSTVDLTVALHAVFDAPIDKIFWDQDQPCYAHRVLTGRREGHRQDAIPMHLDRSESVFDHLDGSAAQKTIVAALAFATARDLNQDEGEVIAVIDEAACSDGATKAALDMVAAADRKLIIISVVRPSETDTPSGPWDMRNCTDGQCVHDLLKMLRSAKTTARGATIYRVRLASDSPNEETACSEGVGAGINLVAGTAVGNDRVRLRGWQIFEQTLAEEAVLDDRLVLVTGPPAQGAMSTVLPERVFQIDGGLENVVSFAAGLAASGLRPILRLTPVEMESARSSLLREVVQANLPVRIVLQIDSGEALASEPLFDTALLPALPHVASMAAVDGQVLIDLAMTMFVHDEGPTVLELPEDAVSDHAAIQGRRVLSIGKGELLKSGEAVALLSIGTEVGACLGASETLQGYGISATVADARFAYPFDARMIDQLARQHAAMVIVDSAAQYGFAASVLEHLADKGAMDRGLRIRILSATCGAGRIAGTDYSAGFRRPTQHQIARAAIEALGAVTGALGAIRA